MGYFSETMANFDAVQSLVEFKGDAEISYAEKRNYERQTHHHDGIGKTAAKDASDAVSNNKHKYEPDRSKDRLSYASGSHNAIDRGRIRDLNSPDESRARAEEARKKYYKRKEEEHRKKVGRTDEEDEIAARKLAKRKAKHESVSMFDFDSVPL